MKLYWIVIILTLATLIFYYPSLKFGFAQDDFIHLSASRINSLGEFVNFFNPFAQFPDIFFYRPLSTQVYFFINNFIFNLSPLPYHIEGLIVQILNSIIFYLLVAKLWQNKSIALLSALLYCCSAIHFLSIYYISSFQEIARMFFILASLYFFVLFRDSSKRKYLSFSILAFIGALLSKETSAILPLLLIPVEALRKGKIDFKNIRSLLKIFSIYFMIVFLYSLVRILGFHNIFHQGDYQLTFSPTEIYQNLKWYLIWGFGLPEVLSNYPNLSGGLITFINDFKSGFLIICLNLVSLTCLIYLFLFSKKTKFILSISVAIYLISLLPILVLHNHKYPQYLDLAFLGLLPLVAQILVNARGKNRLAVFAFLISFTLLQFYSLQISETSHYITHRATVAKHYYQLLKKDYPTLPNNSTVIFEGNTPSQEQLSVSLAKKYAVAVWYPENKVSVLYQISGLTKPPGSITIPITIY